MKKTVVIALLILMFGIGIFVYMVLYQNEQSDALDYSDTKTQQQ